jgi:hypothetical protein
LLAAKIDSNAMRWREARERIADAAADVEDATSSRDQKPQIPFVLVVKEAVFRPPCHAIRGDAVSMIENARFPRRQAARVRSGPSKSALPA